MDNSNFLAYSNDKNDEVKDIGIKANGFLNIQSDLIPNYVIVKSSLFRLWRTEPEKASSILESLIPEIKLQLSNKPIILRSSASKEDFEQRGYYESSAGNIRPEDLKNAITELWVKNTPMLNLHSDANFSVIIQEYIKPKLIGHLSNERRISNRPQRWFYEILNNDNEFVESNYFNAKKNTSTTINSLCKNKIELLDVLRKISSNYYRDRVHIEWVWDGRRIWVVQKDSETKILNNDEPGSIWGKKGKITKTEKKDLLVLKSIKDSKNSWKKVDCVKTFNEIGLPTGEVYILEGKEFLKSILKGIIIEELNEDLKWLISSPIVIRIDLKNNLKHTFLLPRTETLFKIENVKKFLVKNISKLDSQDVDLDDICFLFHRFIISKSCALAYSKPDIPRTRIDSTWGIVDGLYYHPHDSFEYNSSDNRTKERIRCKTEYLDIDELGNWTPKRCNESLDWKDSLTSKEIKKIASYNEKIASFLNKQVTVMYFVGVFENTGYPEILPWYYTTEEIPESSDKFSAIIFSEKKVIVSTRADFRKISKRLVSNEDKEKITIQLKLVPDLLRDRDLLDKIGAFSKIQNIPIELEGSILSHPYYILKKNGATVKVKDPFTPEYQKQTFYKLVRDKIPILIKSKGEYVKAIRINSKQTLELIKQKLIEESLECFWESNPDSIMEELADIYELLRGASKIFDIDIDEIKKIADKKKEKRGGFDDGLFLVETKEESLIEVHDASRKDISINLENGNYDNFSSNNLIPEHKKSVYTKKNNILSIPYTPVLINMESKMREEHISISSNSEFVVRFTPKNIQVKIETKMIKESKDQLKIDFGD